MKFFSTITLVIIGFWAFAQPNPVVQLPEEVCKNETFEAVHTSTGATQFLWEFADGGLQSIPVATNLGATAAANAPDGLTILSEAGNYIGFVVSVNSGNLIRLDFGNSLDNNPTRTDLGNLGGLLSRPRGIAIILYNNNWYGLVTDFNPATGSASVVRLEFGNTLSNTPSADDLGTFSGRVTQPQAVQWVTDNGELIALIGDRAERKILMVNFGQDPTTSTIVNGFIDIHFTGSGFFRDFSVVRGPDRWYGLVIFENGGIHKINFALALFDVPQVVQLTANLPPFTVPSNVHFLRDIDRFIAIVSEYGGTLRSLDFGKNPASSFPVHQNLGNLGSLNNLQGLKFVKTATGWIGFTHNIATSWLHRISFTAISDATLPISTQQQPSLSYATSGTKYVSLQATDGKSESRYVVDSVLVKIDPQADFSFNLNCTGQNTMFHDESITQGTLSWNWNFNDPSSGSSSSILQHPGHPFTAATDYGVVLTVTDDCGNTDQATHTVSVNSAAGITFNINAGPTICSNQENVYSFTSNTLPVENVVWNFGNGETLAAEAPTYVYPQDGEFTLAVDAIINQCMKQATAEIEVKRGAAVSFTYSNPCEDTPLTFTHHVTDPDIVRYEWTFPSGAISTEENPAYTFTDPGAAQVTLLVENSAGCETMLTKNFSIYSLPEVNFAALAPPFSCSGTPTQFNDLTPPPSDSNLSSWSWNFGDAGSSSNTSFQRNPQHTYATAADYSVSLTVATNFLCSTTLQKSVTIQPTPVAAFTHTALCEDSGVTFSDAASGNQAWSWQIGSNLYNTEDAVHVFNNPGTYDILFSVTGANNCMGSTSQQVVVPNKLNVDFTVSRTCVDQHTEFTDITNDSSDPVTGIQWNFGGLGTSLTTPAIFSFPETGTVYVTLTVATQSGCAYPVTKPVNILPGPLAAFTAVPNSGEAPLPVQFINTSLNAISYEWKFNSTGSVSTVASPVFTYLNTGSYTAELIATDANNCLDTTRQLIEVTEPSELNPPAPNPGPGAFTVEWKTSETTPTTLVLVDALGRQIRNFQIVANAGLNRYVVDITGEQPGIYILTIRYLNTVKTYRLMVSE